MLPVRALAAAVAVAALLGVPAGAQAAPSAPVRRAAAPSSTLWRYGASYPNGLPAAATNTTAYAAPAVMQEGEATPWIATGTPDGWVHVRRAGDGSVVRDLHTGPGGVQASPAVVDWDHDGRDDLVAANLNGDLVVWSGDGHELMRTRVFTDNVPSHARGIFSTPVVADLDGDGWDEIVVTSWDHHLYVISHTGAVTRSVFLKDTSWASPAVADVDGDGRPEIVAAWDCDADSTQFDCAYGHPGGFVGVFDTSLTLRWKQFMPGQAAWSSPAVGDVQGTGHPAIVLATGQMPCMMYTGGPSPCGNGSIVDTRSTGRQVYAFDGASGAPLAGWPAAIPDKTMSSPALADVDGDGRLETFVATAGRLYRIDSTGAVRWGAGTCIALQKSPCGYEPLPKVDASPIVGDLLGDGRQLVAIPYDFKISYVDARSGAIVATTEPARTPQEISLALGNGITATTWGGRTRLYAAAMLCRSDCYGAAPVWDAATVAVDSGPAAHRLLWPTFRGGLSRTGVVVRPVVPSGAIGDYWRAHGGAGGPLGAPTGPEVAVPGGRSQSFVGGTVLWGPATGAHAVVGAILARYTGAGGPAAFGLPTTDERGGEAPGTRVSVFQYARIWYGAASGAQPVQGEILRRYLALGGSASVLGLPVAGEGPGPVAGSRLSPFQVGQITWSATVGAHEMHGALLAAYLARGGAARFGLPTSDEHGSASVRIADTEIARLYWTAAAGVSSVQGAILSAYDGLGGPARLGLPVGDEQRAAGTGTPYSVFAGGGQIHWSGPTGAHLVLGAILGRWLALGGPAGIGLPVTDELGLPGVPGGRVSHFGYGDVLFSPPTGAWEVLGAIRQCWLSLGGATSWLGLPVSGEYAVPGGRRSDFVHGSVLWSASTGLTTTVPRS